MPITKRHFDLGINPEIADWMKKIYAYLIRNKDEAFTTDEIESDLQVQTFSDASDLFSTAIQKLEETGAIESRRIRAEWYYSIGSRPLDL